MVDYVEAIKRPFTDIGKLVLGIILSIIPVVNFIFSGYILNVAKSAMNRDMKLPEFKDFGKLFIDGVLAGVIGLVYMLPVLILFGIFMVIGAFSFESLLTGGTFGMLGALAGMGIYIVILAIVGIIFMLLASSAVLKYADTREFGSAFEFGAVSKKAFTGSFLLNWVLTMVIGGVIGFLIGLIPFVGSFLSIYIIGVFSYTALAQAYTEAR